MNKKGGSYNISKEIILWAARVGIVTIVVMIVLSFLGNHVQRQLDVDLVRSGILTQRLFYSPDCFSYQNENGIQVGVIDLDKFNEPTLNYCISYSNQLSGIGINLELKFDNKVRSVEINRAVANKYPAFCTDQDDFNCYNTKHYILVKDQTGLHKGVLTINTVQTK